MKLVGQIGVGVDLHHGHLGQIVDQAGDQSVRHAVFAAERQEELVAQRPDRIADAGQAVFELAVGGHRRERVEARGFGEIDQRLFVERLQLEAGLQDRPRPAAGARAVGNRLLHRHGEQPRVGTLGAGRRQPEELGGIEQVA